MAKPQWSLRFIIFGIFPCVALGAFVIQNQRDHAHIRDELRTNNVDFLLSARSWSNAFGLQNRVNTISGPDLEPIVHLIPKLTNLEEADVTAGSPAVWVELKKLGSVKTLYINLPDELDESTLSGFHSLESVSFKGTVAEVLGGLRDCDSLRHLGFMYPGTIDGLRQLTSLPRLTSLAFIGLAPNHAGSLSSLKLFPKLKRLSITYSPDITDAHLTWLPEMTNLELLDLTSCPGISDETMLLVRSPKLNVLRVGVYDGSENGISEKGLQSVVGIARQSLEEVDVIGTTITESAMDILSTLPRLNRLVISSDVYEQGRLRPDVHVEAIDFTKSLEQYENTN